MIQFRAGPAGVEKSLGSIVFQVIFASHTHTHTPWLKSMANRPQKVG